MTVGLARKLNRTKPHRDALLKNLVSQLFEHGSIVSTHEKCKEASRLAERIVTWSKKDKLDGTKDSVYRRNIQSNLFLAGDNAKLMTKIYKELKPYFEKRSNGFTRVLHLQPRLNDSARQSILELVDYPILANKENGSIAPFQRGNIKFWLLVKATLYDESLNNQYNETTLKNLHKMTLYKDKDTFIEELRLVRNVLKTDAFGEKSDELSPELQEENESKFKSLIDQIYNFKDREAPLNLDEVNGYKLVQQRPAKK